MASHGYMHGDTLLYLNTWIRKILLWLPVFGMTQINHDLAEGRTQDVYEAQIPKS